MKRKTLLSDMPLACLELQGLDMHFRYIQNDGVAAVLKAPVEIAQRHGIKAKITSEDSAQRIISAEQETGKR
ncbi:MAG: hypothetical protein V2I36_14575 [Desulfopila sp.]|jgi:hypothetical protein|nr:hypothetical protein [Desulfopila sp.]